MAKEAAGGAPLARPVLLTKALDCWVLAQRKIAVEQLWRTTAPERYKAEGIPATYGPPPEL